MDWWLTPTHFTIALTLLLSVICYTVTGYRVMVSMFNLPPMFGLGFGLILTIVLLALGYSNIIAYGDPVAMCLLLVMLLCTLSLTTRYDWVSGFVLCGVLLFWAYIKPVGDGTAFGFYPNYVTISDKSILIFAAGVIFAQTLFRFKFRKPADALRQLQQT